MENIHEERGGGAGEGVLICCLPYSFDHLT